MFQSSHTDVSEQKSDVSEQYFSRIPMFRSKSPMFQSNAISESLYPCGSWGPGATTRTYIYIRVTGLATRHNHLQKTLFFDFLQGEGLSAPPPRFAHPLPDPPQAGGVPTIPGRDVPACRRVFFFALRAASF